MATDEVLNAIFRFKFQRPSDVQTAPFCEELVRVVDGVVGAILLPPVEGENANRGGVKEDGYVKERGAEAQGGNVVDGGREKNGDDFVEEDGYVAVDGRDVATEDGSGEESDDDESLMHLDPLLHDRNVPLDVFTASDRVFLERARREYSGRARGEAATPAKGEIWTETWYPEYGSVLQMECTSAGTVQLRLLALDGWKRVVHHLPGNQCVHSAVPECHDVWHCGEMDLSQYPEFDSALTKQLNAAMERTKNERHATLGDGPGHQKTPSFLCSAIRTALTEGQTIYSPTGGSTDVGMHTGGPPRDTCWPLVRLLLKQALPGSHGLFEKVLIRLKCALLKEQLERLRGVSRVQDFWRAADMAFAMLQATVSIITGMIDRGYESSHLERKCARWRKELDALVQRWSNHAERSFVLPDHEKMEKISSSSTCPDLSRPQVQNLLEAQSTFTSGREKALADNHGYEFVDASTCTTEDLVRYLFMPSLNEDQLAVGQRLVETFMYRLANGLEKGSAVTVCKPSSLVKIMKWYRARRTTFAAERKFDQVVRVKTDSQLLLMSWVAFCVCHKTCCASYKQLQLHKIALDWKRLNVAVLPEKDARVALQQVAVYIKTWNGRPGLHPSVFNFSDPAGSILLARTMGQQRSIYPAMYERHISSKHDQIAAMWVAIDKRKQRVICLRDSLSYQETSLQRTEAELGAERAVVMRRQYSSRYVSRTHLEDLERQVRGLTQSIQNMKNELERLIKLNEFYVSPLPSDRIEALAVLFLNYLPSELDSLSELCGLAQRELGQSDSSKYLVSPPCDTSWAAHIAAYGRGCFSEPSTKYLMEYPLQLNVPSSYGPATIDEVSSKDQFARVCAWYPDGNSNSILWKDSSRSFVDPFMIPASDSANHFTAELSIDATSMQWAVAYPSGSKRGNLTYAKCGEIDAASTDFAAYVALGSLRCCPVQQLRRLFEAIQTNSLDWSAHAVAVVAKQAAFQVGMLTDDTLPRFEWHADLECPATLDEFSAMIASLGNQVRSSPSSWVCVPLLGEIAGFLDQFQRGDRRAVRSLSEAARQWAREHRNKWLSGVPTVERIDLRTHECLLYGFALTCYSFGPCDTEDLSSICELIIRFANAYLFATGKQSENVQEVNHIVRRVMATRIVEVIEHVARSPSKILSPLCALVNARVPADLEWTAVVGDGDGDHLQCCFQAIDAARGVHYLVNMFTGSVLTNGLPPGGLPSSIRKHEQFLMLFGDQDFEVIRQDEVYSTAQKLGDCAYSFRLVGDLLLVEETSSLARLQSCTDEWLDSFGSVFPATLSSLYAFWYWEDRDCVLLREKLVANRAVAFVVTFANSLAMCHEVPRVIGA